jgi:hypothetical protein
MTTLTVKEIVKLTGRSETWLRTHVCGWCEQTAINFCRGNCASVYGPRCDAQERIASLKARHAQTTKEA